MPMNHFFIQYSTKPYVYSIWVNGKNVTDYKSSRIIPHDISWSDYPTGFPYNFTAYIAAEADSYGNPTYFFKGYVDEIRISNKVRSDAWIRRSYQQNLLRHSLAFR